MAGDYLVDGEVLSCSGCVWNDFRDETFSVSLSSSGGFVNFDGFNHGPLLYGSGDRCILHGTDSWTSQQYAEPDGSASYSGVGTYHLLFSGDRMWGAYSWVVTKYVGGDTEFVDCLVTYHVEGVRL
jgi:hypothetical protein